MHQRSTPAWHREFAHLRALMPPKPAVPLPPPVRVRRFIPLPVVLPPFLK
jgi:hypothetical protein